MHRSVISPTRSLRRKLLLPLLAAGIVVAALAIWLISATAERQLLLRLRLRAELVAHTVNYVTENVSQASDLNRIVSALGAEKQVSLIVVAGGTPARVIASTHNAWVGELVSELPDVHVAEHMGETLGTRKEEGHLHHDRDQYEFLSPLLLSRTDVARQSVSKGAVLVHLEARSTYDEISRVTWRFAAYFIGVLSGLTALGYALLNSHVLRPIAALGQYLNNRSEATPRCGLPISTDDEIGGFASVLHGALTRTDFAVRELERQKIELQALFDLMPAMICFKDTGNRILRANQRLAEAMGMPLAAIEGKSTDELLPEYAARYYADDLEVIRSGLPSMGIVETRQDPEGQEFWFQTDRVPCCDAAGKVIGIIIMTQDITARRQAEEELRRKTALLEAQLNASLDGILVVDGEGRRVLQNRQTADLFKMPAAIGDGEDDAAKINWAANVAKNHDQFVERITFLYSHPEEISRDEIELKDGTVLDRYSAPVVGTDGKYYGRIWTFRDITERKAAAEALRLSEERLRAALSASGTGTFRWDIRTNEVNWDESLDALYGLPPGQTVRSLEAFLATVHDGDLPGVIERCERSAREGTGFDMEFRVLWPNGLVHWLDTKAKTFSDAAGRPLYMTGACVDITERKLAELEISRAKQEIEQLNADLERRVERRTKALSAATAEAERANLAKSEFLSRMSHELRTPMNAILGFAQVLETEDGLNADQRDSVNQILKGGSHLLALINEVLDITSIDAGRMTISTEPVALKDLVAESIGLLQPLAAELKVRLVVMPEEVAGQYVLADRQRLKQVLLNLVGNAIKYNRPRGSVTVRCVTMAGALGGSDATIRLAVTDTGPGLNTDQLARLFNPFERLGAEQTRVKGTGLGLMLAKRMVERMGGTIGVESVIGEGSTFWVEFRATEAPEEEPEERASERDLIAIPEAPAARRTLLYVEDNPANVRLITRILARRPDIEVLCAETGALGLKMAREHRPDLILLDLHLPDSHGDEVLAQLRADARTAEIPVVMLTADAQPGKRDQLVAAGAQAYLTKPVVVPTFLATINRFIELQPEVTA